MKKILTLFLALTMVYEGFSQVIGSYSWDFTASSTFPAGFVTWNLDGQTVNSNLTGSVPAFSSTAGWVEIPAQVLYSVPIAACASYFTNSAVACDRWLVTPPMNIPTGAPNVCLEWNAASLSPVFGYSTYLDNYEVLISTTDSATSSFTTTALTITGESGNFPTRLLPLAAYAGQTVRVAFRDVTTNGIGLQMYKISLDTLPSYAAVINDVEIYEHNYIGNGVPVTGTMSNNGFDTINTFTLNYSVNGGAPVTSAQTGAGLLPQQSYYYTHPTIFNPTTAGTYTIQVWFSQLNGTTASSDTSTVTVFFYPQVSGVVKNVVIEEMTGAGCPWCSGGALTLRDAYEHNPSYVIPVAIHSADINDLGVSPADALQITDGETVCTAVATGYPTAMVDRLYTFDNAALATNVQTSDGQYGTYQGPTSTYIWDTIAQFRHTNATPVNVSFTAVSIDSSSSPYTLTATVNANFLNSLSQGTYRINMYVVEDSVLTPAGNNGNGYNQNNTNYSGQSSSGSSELYSLAAVLTDNGQVDEWAQNHVLRDMVGGPWGSTTADIPSAPAAGTTYTHTYSTTIDPTVWRMNYIKIVGLVQEYNASNINMRTILNASEMKLLPATNTGIKETSQLTNLMVYPNPASDMATVQMDMKDNAMVTISVIDALGQVAVEPTNTLLNAGTHSINIPVSNLNTGLYVVKVSVNGEVSTLPLSITSK